VTPYDDAVAQYRAGRWAEAIALCRAGLAEAPDHPALNNLLGVCLVSAGNPADAIAPLERAVARDPEFPGAMANLALTLHNTGDAAGARRRYRQLAAIDPQNPGAYNRLALLTQDEGDLERAERLMARAALLVPSNSTEWSNLAAAAINAGQLHRADRAIDRALAINPADATAFVTAATIRMRLGRQDEALTLARNAQRLDPATAELPQVADRSRQYQVAMQSAALGAAAGDAPGLVLRGPFDTPSGYAHMGRRYIQALRAQAVPLHVVGLLGPERWQAEPLDRPVPARAMVNIMIPLAVEPVPGLATVTYSMFEGPRIPRPWVRLSQSSDLIVVPTRSSRLAWADQGFPDDRIRVCPLGVDTEPGAQDSPAMVLVDSAGRHVSSYRHRFLNMSDMIPRKNLDGLLRVWLRVTRPTDDAVLILKPGKGGGSAMADLRRIVAQTEAHLGRRFAQAAPILVVDAHLDEAQITGLFRAASHYWSMSHGEGWDLPMARAGAMGLGLIAPAHSAYLDYLDDGIARMIPSSVAPARQPYGDAHWPPFFGLDWWQPDEDAAAQILEDILRDRTPPLPDASSRLLGAFSWDQAATTLRRTLADAGLMADPGRAA